MYYWCVILSGALYRLYTSQTAEHGSPDNKMALEWDDPKQKQNDTAIRHLPGLRTDVSSHRFSTVRYEGTNL